MFEELEKINSRPEPFEFYKWLQYFNPEALEREFVTCGFSIEKFYANVAGLRFNPDGTEFAVIARKL